MNFGENLFNQMKKENDFTIILNTAREKYGVPADEAETYLDAFLQWFSLLPLVNRKRLYVMLEGRVDDIFHSFILDNDSFYQEFCQRYIGRYMGHHPKDLQSPEALEDGVQNTLEMFQEYYGEKLHPELKNWFDQYASKTYAVTCHSKQCPDDITQTPLFQNKTAVTV